MTKIIFIKNGPKVGELHGESKESYYSLVKKKIVKFPKKECIIRDE